MNGRISSEIAIDDIFLIENAPIEISTTTQPSTTTKRPIQIIETLTSCSFDRTMCGWSSMHPAFSWSNTETAVKKDEKNGERGVYGPISDFTSICMKHHGLYFIGKVDLKLKF